MEVYNEQYYHSGCGPIPYEEPDHWVHFFGIIADRIVADFAPKTVLDAGCAMGYLVAALRDRGVEAYGVDISKYAISKVREDVKPFCTVGSLTEELPPELPKHFDLVTNIEVLEHLYAEDGLKAVQNICKLTDTVIFSSTPDDFTEPTHLNVQQREYWARLFAQCGFFDDIAYRPKYLTYHAVCYRRQKDILRQVEDYERVIRMTDAEAAKQANLTAELLSAKSVLENRCAENEKTVALLSSEKEELSALLEHTEAEKQVLATSLDQKKNELAELIKNYEAEMNQRDAALQAERADLCELRRKEEELQKELNQCRENYTSAVQRGDELAHTAAAMQAGYDAISNAFFWKITKPIRVTLDWIKKPLRKVPLFRLMAKGLRCWRRYGFRYTWQKVVLWKKGPAPCGNINIPEPKNVSEDIKFSILVPLYNTDETGLTEMIQSVVDQTYQNWELCLADGSDEAHAYVEEICKKYSNLDGRIKFRRLRENKGISANTNHCAEMATGDYLALLDHDDILAKCALSENAFAIMQTGADVLYSDEDHLTANGIHVNPFFKPDWSPDLLYSQMYICHFLVFRRDLFERVGGFRSAFDGSQDYDLMLRMSKATDRICHIPEILYSWRESPSSTAANPEAKPYAHTAGLRALDEALKSKYGEGAYAEETKNTFVYNPRFPLNKETLISIIIPMKDKWEMTEECIHSILKKSSYANYEIILLDNRSEEAATHAWFERIQCEDRRIRVVSADMEFNWSKLNNYGMSVAKGDIFVFLNNDTLVISEDWLDRLAENALRPDIGVVGGLLLYPDNTIQHAGVVVGIGGWADHVFKGQPAVHYGSPYVSPVVSRNVLAVTGACMAVSRKTIEKIGNFDESFVICGSDVEICIRAYESGLFNRYDAAVRLYHLESKSRDTYIPEIDFKRSYEVYAFYRENGDPFFNRNLDNNSPIPKETSAPMNIVNFKNFLKRYPLVVDLYHMLRSKPALPENCRIPEIEPILPRRTEDQESLRLNLLIPSLNSEHVFGGISTALKMFESIRKHLGCSARLIVVDAPLSSKGAVIPEGYIVNRDGAESVASLEVVPFANRSGKRLPVAKNDVFMATGWWTAYAISSVVEWQSNEYQQEMHPILYMVQDYEPGFYPWSSRYLMADSTYRLKIPTYAIINSSVLAEHFKMNGYAFEKSWIFEPVLNGALRAFLPAQGCTIEKKKQIIVYGRPTTARNAFELLVYSLRQWASIQPDASEWTVLSAGEAHKDIELGNGVCLHSVGKLPLEEYAKVLLESYAGVSLMVSPHPSYPPLEMAAFGVKVITNCYGNKDLRDFSANVTSLKVASEQSISEALEEICCNYSGTGIITANEAYLSGGDQFENVSAAVAEALSPLSFRVDNCENEQ